MDGLIKRTGLPPRDGRVRVANMETANSRAAHTESAPTRKYCLLVDDSRMIRNVARRILEGVGYEVAEAEDGQEALAKCRENMPDLIMVDWHMPVMSGIEFVSALRQMEDILRPKVLFCSTNSDPHAIHKGIDAGADEYVIKPFDQSVLLSKLQNIDAL